MDHNARNGITGALYYDGRVFVQILEGHEMDVDPLLQRIVRDPRHKNITITDRIDIASRLFYYWNMKFVYGPDRPMLFRKKDFDPETFPRLRPQERYNRLFNLYQA